MAIRNLSALMNVDEARYRPLINTGGPLDMLSGKFVPSAEGGWALSGGVGLTNASIGGPNTFKSTLSNGACVNALARFPGSEFILDDTENAVSDRTRLAKFSDLYLDDSEQRATHLAELEERITLLDTTSDKAETLDAFFDLLKVIRDEKVQHHKDYIRETEILDPGTGKPYLLMTPTFVSIDSWTMALVRQLGIRNEEHNADTEMKEQRMIHMEEGWQKSRLMSQLPTICAKGGIHAFITGHIGRKQSLDGKPVKKDMTYMPQDETVKAMGPKFNFLMTNIYHINKAIAMVYDGDRNQSQYPSKEGVASNELNQLMITLSRSKNAPAGTQTQMVCSQRFGAMGGLSYYNYLREHKYYGLGNPRSTRNPLLPDIDLGRTRIFEESKTYKVRRALELTYQLFVIQTSWTLMDQPVDYSMTIDQFSEHLSKSTYAADDILNSRGWWTFKDAGKEFAEANRPFLTLPDILSILNGSYKPKFLPVS